MYYGEGFRENNTSLDGVENIEIHEDDVESIYLHDEEYVDYNGVKRVLQVLIPNKFINNDEKYPLIVFVQGSAWMKQDVYMRIPSFDYLCKKGFVVAIVQYRESEIAPFPAQVQDTKAAIRFLRKYAEKYRVDTDNVFVWGDSSGGHTALLTGVTENVKELDSELFNEYSCHVNGIIDFYGVVDIRMEDGFPSTENHQQPDSPEGMLLGHVHVLENLELARKTVPTEYLDTDIPPVLILHGTKDRIVSFEHSVKMYEALKEKNKEVEFYSVKNADHGGPVFFRESTLDIVVNFIKNHLK